MSAQPGKFRLLLRLLVVLVLVGAAAMAVYFQLRPTAIVATVTRGLAADIVSGSVVVHADKDLQPIKSELSGRVAWIDPRQLGEPFKEGEPILKLDSADLERAIKDAETNYQRGVERRKIQKQIDVRVERARDQLQAAQRAFKRGEISEEQLKENERALKKVENDLVLEDFDAEQARIAHEMAQAERKRQLEKMTIRAPMDGILQSVQVAEGALIGSGHVVATFFSNERVVIAKVGEEDVARVRVGQPARVRLLNTGGQEFDATVRTILPFAAADTQRFDVYLDVTAEPAKLMPFSTGEATITIDQRENSVLIPRRALFNDNHVFVVKDGVVERRQVRLGYRALNFAEVLNGLTEGEQVIVENVDQHRDGQRVRVVEEE